MRTQVQSVASISGLRIGIAVSCGVGRRWGSDPVLLLLCLWHRWAATALMQPLAWGLQYAAGAALGEKKKKNLLKNENFLGVPWWLS